MKLAVEITRSAEDLEKAGYDPFETNPAWTHRRIAMEIGDWFEMLGLPRRMAHGKKIVKYPKFLEFDSGNKSHACGYWLVEIEVSKGLYALVQKAAASED